MKTAMKDMNVDHEDALNSMKMKYSQQIVQLQEEVEAQKRAKVK